MKTTKRLIAMAAALTLTACAAAPVFTFADGEGYTVTVTASDSASHKYEAYQIFSGELEDGVLKNIVWGTGVNGSNLLTALKKSTIGNGDNAPTNPLASFFSDVTDAKGVADVLANTSNFSEDNDNMKVFAKFVGENLTNVKSGTGDSGKVDGLTDGYYLIQDSESPSNSGSGLNSGAKTRWLIKVVGSNITVNAKHSAPSVMKKVEEKGYNTSTGDSVSFGNADSYVLEKDYNDVADYNIGDSVPFTLYGSLPSTYADYEHYYMEFEDTLSTGFVLPNASDVKVYCGNTELTDAQKTASGLTITSNGTKINVVINDTKKITTNANDVIRVKYSAKLDTDAVIGLDGNPNEVKLIYSNNPNNTGNGTAKPDDTGDTPVDKVVVFTYEQDFTKVDSVNTSTKINDAEFKLQRKSDSKWLKVINTTANVDGDYIVSEWVETENEASVLKSKDGEYKVKGLEDGSYILKETKTPSTYNNPTDDTTELTITATTANGQNWNGIADALTALRLSVSNDANLASVTMGASETNQNLTNGIVAAQIKNIKGSTLPTTGGTGTKVLYAIGGSILVGAGMVLVSKKRAQK